MSVPSGLDFSNVRHVRVWHEQFEAIKNKGEFLIVEDKTNGKCVSFTRDHFVDTDKGRKCVHDCFYIYKNGREYKVKGVLLGGKDNDPGAVFEAEQDKDDEDIIKLKETYMDKYREKNVNKYVINLKSCSCVKI